MNTVKMTMAVALLVALLAALAPGQMQPTEQEKGRAAEIEKYIAVERQKIELRYAARLAEAQSEYMVRLGKLDIGDNRKFIQTGFFGWATYIEEVLRLNGVDLRNDAEYAATLRKFRGGGLTAVEQLDQTPKLLAIAEKRLEEERGRVMRFFAQEQAQIEKAKQYALNVRLAELETTLMADQQKPAKTAPAGMVTAVVYSADARTALVGSTAARKGDKIGDIQVVDISEDTVTFQVGDRKWTQRVGEAPPAQWR